MTEKSERNPKVIKLNQAERHPVAKQPTSGDVFFSVLPGRVRDLPDEQPISGIDFTEKILKAARLERKGLGIPEPVTDNSKNK